MKVNSVSLWPWRDSSTDKHSFRSVRLKEACVAVAVQIMFENALLNNKVDHVLLVYDYYKLKCISERNRTGNLKYSVIMTSLCRRDVSLALSLTVTCPSYWEFVVYCQMSRVGILLGSVIQTGRLNECLRLIRWLPVVDLSVKNERWEVISYAFPP